MPRKKLTEEEKIEKNRIDTEKRIQENLERDLKDLRERYAISEPVVHYEVGERVSCGVHNCAVVSEILDNGKILRLAIISVHEKYGEKITTNSTKYIAWHDVEKYKSAEENKKTDVFTKTEDIFITFLNQNIMSLLICYYHFGVDMEPDYQRGNVWLLEDKVKLIDSIFNNVEIGKFVFIHRDYSAEKLYEILDGKQRLTALIEFKERRFKYKGKNYDELSNIDQNHFENYAISVGEISSNRGRGNLTDEQKYRYFLKLNTSGKPQDLTHIQYVKNLWENSKA